MLVYINGIGYDVPVRSLKRLGEIRDGPAACNLMDNSYSRDVSGTYYDYELVIDSNKANITAYDAFYQAISAPADNVEITVPYGQSVLEYKAYIKTFDDDLIINTAPTKRWKNLKIRFYAKEPQKIPA